MTTDNDDNENSRKEKDGDRLAVFGLNAGTFIVIGSIIGTGYVANYRLGKIEEQFGHHQAAGHLPQAISLVELRGNVASLKSEFERIRARMRILEEDRPFK